MAVVVVQEIQRHPSSLVLSVQVTHELSMPCDNLFVIFCVFPTSADYPPYLHDRVSYLFAVKLSYRVIYISEAGCQGDPMYSQCHSALQREERFLIWAVMQRMRKIH